MPNLKRASEENLIVVLSGEAQEKLISVSRDISSRVLSEAAELAKQREAEKPETQKVTITANDVDKAIIKVCSSVCQK